MKKPCLAALLLLLAVSCSKEKGSAVFSIKSISQTEFDCSGGFGAAEIETSGATISASSSAPEWLRVSVADEKVLYSVFPNTQSEARSGRISVSSTSGGEASFEISQSAFKGVLCSASSIEFSQSPSSRTVEVICSGEFSASLGENPQGTFSLSRNGALISIATSAAQTREETVGRLDIVPEDPSIEPLHLTLTLKAGSDYSYLLGLWEVARNTDGSADKSSFVFEQLVKDESYLVRVQKGELADYPFTAEFIDGKVRIGVQGFGVDASLGRYYSIHFNGPTTSSPTGTYIFATPGADAWEATPVFDEDTGSVTLSFDDAGITTGHIPQQMNLWWSSGKYFAFTTKLVSYQDLVLRKTYLE